MRRIALALALALGLMPQAYAWNDFGHMLIAAAAYEQLTPATRARANRLLKLNPSYNQWVAGRRAPERDELAFMLAATWPDQIRARSDYSNDGEHPNGPDAARNIGYADKLQHRYWHYINLPFSPDGTPLVDPATPNVVTQIGAFRKALAAADTSDDVKSYDLVWLLHLVGDVHQPLHAADRFTRSQRAGDEGGNLVALCKKPCRNELHAYWDELLGTSKKPAAALAEVQNLPKPRAGLAAIGDESQWAQDSLLLAQKVAYSDPPVGRGAGPYTLNEDYHSDALHVAQTQAALAAARLAHLLNETLGKGPAS
jgi:hypothetical protein